MRLTLRLAAIYNMLWGVWVILFPQHYFELIQLEPPIYPMIWQGTGMIVGVYGLGYWWASYDPYRHWPIVAVGFLGKIFGPLGFLFNYISGKLPIEFGYTLLTNDLVWWIPFGIIMIGVHRDYGWKLKASY